MRFHRRLVYGAFALFVSFSSQAYLDHWNSGTGGKPSRNGLTWERGPINPTILWQGGIDSIAGFQPVMEGNIVVMSRVNAGNSPDPPSRAVIAAQNLSTGELLWTNSLPVDFPETDWFDHVVAIREKKVYVTRAGNGNASYLYALDAGTGQILWKSRDVTDIYLTESPSFAPNGDLVIGNYFNISRVNASNGVTIWSTHRTIPAGGSGEPAVFGDRVYTWESSGYGPKVSTFNLADGSFIHSSAGLGGMFQQIGLFVGPDGTIYAPRAQNAPQVDYLVALQDTPDGLVEKWRVPLGYVPFASFAVGPDGSVYSYSPNFRVIRIRPSDGVTINSSLVMPSDFYQPRMAIDSAGIVFVSNGGFSQGALFSFNANLSLRWTVPIANINVSGPAIGKNGTLIVSGSGTNVMAFRGNSDGLAGPPIQIAPTPGGIVISYSGKLEFSDQIPGPWLEVPDASSPYTISVTNAQRFYRSNQQ